MNTKCSEKKNLPKEALLSLKEILKKDIGVKAVESLSDVEISQIGYFFLTLTAIQGKIRLRERDTNRLTS